MIPVVLGLGGLIAKVAAAAVIPRLVGAIARSLDFKSPAQPQESAIRLAEPPAQLARQAPSPQQIATARRGASQTGLIRKQATAHNGDYGEPIVDQGTVYNPYRWNGEPLDAESGLTDMRNRYYQAATGRFIQRDPISYAGGLNLYSFGNSDPINFSDPSGFKPIFPDTKLGGPPRVFGRALKNVLPIVSKWRPGWSTKVGTNSANYYVESGG